MDPFGFLLTSRLMRMVNMWVMLLLVNLSLEKCNRKKSRSCNSKPLTMTIMNNKPPQLHDIHESSNNLNSLINKIGKEIEDSEKTYNLNVH